MHGAPKLADVSTAATVAAMAYEYLVGLNVTDDEGYEAYCDFTASLRKGPPGATINRVFTIYYPSADAATAFYADARYGRTYRVLYALCRRGTHLG